MPTIPKRQRNKLASELVGTPSQDQSSQIIARGVADLATGIGHLGQQMARKEADINKAKQNIVDLTDSNKNIIEYRGLVSDYDKSFKAMNKDNHNNVREDYSTGLQKMLESQMQGISSPAVKASFNRMGQDVIGSSTKGYDDWYNDNQNFLAVESIMQSQNSLSNQAYNADSIGEVSELMKEHNGLVFTSSQALSQEETMKINVDGKKSIALGYAYGRLDNDPSTLLEELKNGSFDEYLDPKEKKSFIDQSLKSIENIKTKLDTERVAAFSSNHTDLWDKYKKGELTNRDIASMESAEQIDGATASAMTNLIGTVKKVKKDTVAQAQRYFGLNDAYSKITKDVKGKKTKITYDELIKYKNDVINNLNEGYITARQANTFLSKMSPILEESIGGEIGEKTIGINVYEYGTESVKDLAEKEGRGDDWLFMGRALEHFNNSLDNKDLTQSQNPEQRKELRKKLNSAINLAKVDENPFLATLDGTPDVYINENDQRVNLAPSKEKVQTKNKINLEGGKLQRNNKTGKERIVYPDGRIKNL